jgi:hypothetical protein
MNSRPPGSFERKNNGLPGHSLGRPTSGQEAGMATDLHFRCFSLETTGRPLGCLATRDGDGAYRIFENAYDAALPSPSQKA